MRGKAKDIPILLSSAFSFLRHFKPGLQSFLIEFLYHNLFWYVRTHWVRWSLDENNSAFLVFPWSCREIWVMAIQNEKVKAWLITPYCLPSLDKGRMDSYSWLWNFNNFFKRLNYCLLSASNSILIPDKTILKTNIKYQGRRKTNRLSRKHVKSVFPILQTCI